MAIQQGWARDGDDRRRSIGVDELLFLVSNAFLVDQRLLYGIKARRQKWGITLLDGFSF